MSKQTEALKLALEALAQIDEAMPFPVAKLAQKVIREALAQPEPSAYWHSEFLKYNTTSDRRMMENAQGDLERIKLVQTGVGIGKPEQEPVACPDGKQCKHGAWCTETYCQEHCEFRAPPQRKPLTDEEIAKIAEKYTEPLLFRVKDFARAIEAAHGIKGEA